MTAARRTPGPIITTSKPGSASSAKHLARPVRVACVVIQSRDDVAHRQGVLDLLHYAHGFGGHGVRLSFPGRLTDEQEPWP